MRLTLASLLAVFVLAPLAIAAVPPVAPELRSFLESTHELSTFFTRDSRVETRRKETATTVSHIDKTDGSKEQAKYTRLPPNTYCKDRSAVTAGDQDLLNKPSTNTHPLPGQPAGYILCSGIKKPNTSKYISVYLVQPKRGNSKGLNIHTIRTHIKPDNYDAENDKSFSYHYNMTLPGNLKGKWTFYLLENYDVYEPQIKNLVLTQSFPLSVS